ncbi:MAG: hypothetical protein ACFNL6_02635 [Candidatus Nanoperiomorbus sp.]
MNNMNHPSHDYQLPDDSFLYNLDVNDWSMLAHPEETDQPDDNRADDDLADKADDSSEGNLSDGHGYSLEISAIDPELEQMMLEVEYGRRKLEELEQMLPETRRLLQEYGERASFQTFQLDSEFEQAALEAEQLRLKLEETEQMLEEARQLIQELEESEEQGPRQTLRPDAKRESPKGTTSLTSEELEETRNSRPGNHGQFKEMNQGIDWGYGMGRR